MIVNLCHYNDVGMGNIALILQKVFGLIGLIVLLLYPASAQDTASVVISAENIARLASVAHIDFGDAPAEIGRIDNGWFALSPGGDLVSVMSRAGELVTWTTDGRLLDHYAIPGSDGLAATILDAGYNTAGDMLVSVHAEGGVYYVVYRWVKASSMEYYRFEMQDTPLRVWVGSQVGLEVSSFDPAEPRYVLLLNPRPLNRIRENEVLMEGEITRLDSGPENDPDSYLRVGRIEPPLAITVTREGLVKRWSLENGQVSAEAQLDTLPGAGQVSADGRYFVWRDGESKALHLLDFKDVTDRIVTSLDGAFIPFLLVTPGGDGIISVNMGGKPIVAAWDTESGVRYDLGEYRVCERQSDMARLSSDGTTLVIGCESGLDVWRVKE